jgi:hypothetical protein
MSIRSVAGVALALCMPLRISTRRAYLDPFPRSRRSSLSLAYSSVSPLNALGGFSAHVITNGSRQTGVFIEL